MPYIYKKEGSKYAVYKKDSKKLVGKTAGTKKALRKYLAALHRNENMSSIKLKSLVESIDTTQGMSSEQKKAFLEAVYKFSEHSDSIYRKHSLRETSEMLRELLEAANHLTLSETEDWFDKVTVSRHMKQLGEAFKIFEKTADEIETLQQRLESAYEDIGGTLSKYYDINGMVTEASESSQSGADYSKFVSKALKKFKVKSPEDISTEKQKRRVFSYADKGFESTIKKSDKKSEK